MACRTRRHHKSPQGALQLQPWDRGQEEPGRLYGCVRWPVVRPGSVPLAWLASLPYWPLVRQPSRRHERRSRPTCKLGLLRALCRIADGAAGLAYDVDDTPHGRAARACSIDLAPPVLAARPRRPAAVAAESCRGEKLSFAGPGFRALLADDLSPLDLRVGERFTGARARALIILLRQSVRLSAQSTPCRRDT